METTVNNNPFETQLPKPPNPGLVGGNMMRARKTQGEMPFNVGTTAPATPNVATYQPTARAINQPTETVQGQVNSILSKDSPLMQRARTLATQQMAQRGLVNSSMAAGASTAAMIDRALPMAQQDANAYQQASQDNMNAVNQAGQFNSSEINKFGLQTGQQKFEAEQAAINRQFQTSERTGAQAFASSLETAKQNFTAAQAQLDRAQQTALADKSIDAQQALQTAQQNFSAAQAALDRTQQTSLQQGQQSFQAVQSALDRTQQSTLQAGQQQFQAGQAALDRAQQTSLQTVQQNFQSAQAALDRAQQVALADKSVAAQQALQVAQQNFTAAQADLDRRQQTAIQLGQQEFTAAQQKIQNDFAMRVQQLQESGQDFRQARDIASREAMTRLEQMGVQNRFDQELALKTNQFNVEQFNAERRLLIQNQAELDKLGIQIAANRDNIPTSFAAQISANAMNGVNAIMADGNLNAEAKQAAINNIVGYANSQIAWGAKFYGTQIPAIGTPSSPTSVVYGTPSNSTPNPGIVTKPVTGSPAQVPIIAKPSAGLVETASSGASTGFINPTVAPIAQQQYSTPVVKPAPVESSQAPILSKSSQPQLIAPPGAGPNYFAEMQPILDAVYSNPNMQTIRNSGLQANFDRYAATNPVHAQNLLLQVQLGRTQQVLDFVRNQ